MILQWINNQERSIDSGNVKLFCQVRLGNSCICSNSLCVEHVADVCVGRKWWFNSNQQYSLFPPLIDMHLTHLPPSPLYCGHDHNYNLCQMYVKNCGCFLLINGVYINSLVPLLWDDVTILVHLCCVLCCEGCDVKVHTVNYMETD